MRKSSYLSEVLFNSKKNLKLTKNDIKTKESISEPLTEPLASYSKSEFKTYSSNQKLDKTCNKVLLSTNRTENMSTKLRYNCHPKHLISRTGVTQSLKRVEEATQLTNTSALIKTSTTFQTIVPFICKKCDKSFESKEDFEQHFNKFHSKQNLPKIFKKLKEPTLLAKQTIKVSINQTTIEQESNSFHSNAILTHSSSLRYSLSLSKHSIQLYVINSSKVDDNRNKSSKQKFKKKYKIWKSKSKTSQHSMDSTDGQSSNSSLQLSTNYCYQKCKLCSLVDSLEKMDKHILNVHHDQILIKHRIQKDMSPYRSILVVKTPIDMKTQ